MRYVCTVFVKGRDIRRRGCRADKSRNHLVCFTACTFMTSTCSRSNHCPPHAYSAPLKRFVAHSDKRCRTSKSFFTYPSKCYFSSLSTTCFTLSAPAQSHLLTAAHSTRIRAPTLRIVVASGTLFGAALSRFPRVHGLQFILTSHVLRRGRQRIVFKDGYGTQFFRLSSTAFHCLSARC